MIITLEHMKNVVMLSKDFKDYIKALHDGRDDEYIAKARDLRNDCYKGPSDLVPSKRQGGGLRPYRPKHSEYEGESGRSDKGKVSARDDEESEED